MAVFRVSTIGPILRIPAAISGGTCARAPPESATTNNAAPAEKWFFTAGPSQVAPRIITQASLPGFGAGEQMLGWQKQNPRVPRVPYIARESVGFARFA